MSEALANDELHLDPKQQEAIDLCIDVTKRVVAVTGSAGTGKTTIIRRAFKALERAGYRVALCAPTGKAAKRIYEATGIEAQTLHRLLEFSHPGDPDPKTGKPVGISVPRRNRQNPLEYDFIFADEYAMANWELHRALFDALPNGGSIRVFGDNNQLQPIEEDKRLKDEPSPFTELLNNSKFSRVVLTHVFRQGKDSGILLNATNIIRGVYPKRNEQFDIVYTDKPLDAIRKAVLEGETIECASYAATNNQIIVPQNKGPIGTRAINTMIQGMFHNELEPCIFLDRKSWVEGENGKKGGFIRAFVGDKVIFTSNNYELSIFNGESGTIIEIDDDTGEVVVDFGDREQAIPPVMLVQNRHGEFSQIDPRKDLDLAYAITTHKSQGSEYQSVLYMVNRSNYFMLNRKNFYTAVSRAREHVTLVTDQKGLSAAVSKRE